MGSNNVDGVKKVRDQGGGNNMKRYLELCASVLLLAITIASPASTSPSASAPAVEKIVSDRSLAFVDAALNGDLTRFGSFMSDDYVMLYIEPASNGKKAHWVTRTKEEWVEQLSSGKHKYRSVNLLNTNVYLHGEVATFAGDYTETGTREGVEYSDLGQFSETWVKRHGQWVIVASVFP
jgi:ketosteroid isomerase-like protein